MGLWIPNVLKKEQLPTRLEYLCNQRFDGLLWLGHRTEREYRHECIDGLIAAQRCENGGGVLGATGEEDKGAGCFGESGCVCGTADLVVHKDVGFESDVFGDASGIEVFRCVTVALTWDEHVGWSRERMKAYLHRCRARRRVHSK